MQTQMKRVAGAATFGTVIEWYDFFLYGTAAALVFPKLFFPASDPLTGTLLSFAIYATGFAARPIGGLLTGHFGDRVGRKPMLIATLLTMGLATAAIGLLPTHASVGALAPILLVGLRVVQGIAAGGEFAGAALLTVEYAPAGRRGFWGSLLTVGILLGLVLGTVMFGAVDAVLPESAFMSWGWRIPFLLSVVLVAVGLYVRTRVDESPEFEQVKARGDRSSRPLVDALHHPRNLLAILGMRVAENAFFYVIAVFTLAYATTELGHSRSLVLTAIVIGALLECGTAVALGRFSDRVGYRPILILGLAFQVVFAFPYFWLLDTGSSFGLLIAIVLGMAVANGAISSVQAAYFAECFPPGVRYSGISIGRETGTILGGGVMPLVATWLLARAGSPWPVAALLVVTSVLGIVATVYARLEPARAVRSERFARRSGGDAEQRGVAVGALDDVVR
jgi:MFS family permease